MLKVWITARSTLRWATVLSVNIVWNSSIHSMLPMYPCSPAPQLANMIVLRGLQPFFNINPNTLTISIIQAVAELGSTEPYVQASRWFPNITYLSNTKKSINWHFYSHMMDNLIKYIRNYVTKFWHTCLVLHFHKYIPSHYGQVQSYFRYELLILFSNLALIAQDLDCMSRLVLLSILWVQAVLLLKPKSFVHH